MSKSEITNLLAWENVMQMTRSTPLRKALKQAKRNGMSPKKAEGFIRQYTQSRSKETKRIILRTIKTSK